MHLTTLLAIALCLDKPLKDCILGSLCIPAGHIWKQTSFWARMIMMYPDQYSDKYVPSCYPDNDVVEDSGHDRSIETSV